MNINKLPLKLFAGLIILSFFASCNSGNKVVSSFGKRKYTKGYFFNAPQSNKVVARQSKSTAMQPVAVTKNTLPEKALQPTTIQPSIQEKESVNIKHSSQNNTLKHSPTDFPDTLKEKKGTSSNIHIYVNTDANKRSKQLDADAAASAGFMWGILGIATVILGVGVVFGVIGLIMSLKGIKSKEEHSKAVIGLLLSILTIIGFVVLVFLAINALGHSG